MQARGVLADVVTCCSLINALERGGQWQLAEQLFVQMCAASWQAHGVNSPLYRIMEIAAAPAFPQDAESALTDDAQAPELTHAGSWGRSNSDLSLVMHESPGTAAQQSKVPGSAIGTSPMLASAATTPQATTIATVIPPGRSLDSSVSKYSTGGPSDRPEKMTEHSPDYTPDKMTLRSQDSGSDPQAYRGDPNSLFSHNPAGAIGRDVHSSVTPTTPSSTNGQMPQSASNSSGIPMSTDMTSTVMQTPPYRNPSGSMKPSDSINSSSSSIALSPSDYTPKYLDPRPSPDPSLASSEQGSDLLRSFSNMRVGDTNQSVQRALFPPETLSHQDSFNQGSNAQPDLAHQTSLTCMGRALSQENSLINHSSGLPQRSLLHASSFTQGSSPQTGLHHQSSLNSLTSQRGLRHANSFTQGSSEQGVLRHQNSFGHASSPEDGGSNATIRRIQEAAVNRWVAV